MQIGLNRSEPGKERNQRRSFYEGREQILMANVPSRRCEDGARHLYCLKATKASTLELDASLGDVQTGTAS